MERYGDFYEKDIPSVNYNDMYAGAYSLSENKYSTEYRL